MLRKPQAAPCVRHSRERGNPASFRIRSRRGFSLIELMVGMAVGLVVVGSVVAFIASSIQANSENIRSIRLNQELRALTEVVAREVRRARYVQAQIGTIGATPPVTSPYNRIAAGANCLQFSYQPVTVQAAGGGTTTLTAGRAFWVENNQLMAAQGAINAATPVVGCNNGTAISSAEVRITGFAVTDVAAVPPAAGPCDPAVTAAVNATCDVLDISITGELGPAGDTISRTFSQRVRIRSSVAPAPPPPPPPPPPP